MEIIGRLKEKSIFNKIFESKQAEFIAVYGRRRVGKTFLIKNSIAALANKSVYLECGGMKDGSLKDQLINFTKSFSKAFYNDLEITPKKTWREAFELLTMEIKNKIKNKSKKIIIFLDELPWLATARSDLIQNLDYFWNNEWCNLSNFKLIVCGSAASWMLNNLINAKGGLYNRITKTILLEPFNLAETKQFLESKKIKLVEQQIVDLYMVMGGIPFYLNQLDPAKSISENINILCFEKDGLLYSEFPRLFKSLFNASDNYMQIVQEIAKKRYGVSFKELVAKTKNTAGGRFKERLDELEACGFIQKYLPYAKTKRDCYYRVIDEYTLFYLKWIAALATNSDVIKGINYWYAISKSPSWYSWAGFSFETIVYKHINKIIKILNLETIGCSVYHYRFMPINSADSSGAQIDLLIDRNDNAITICEIKYSNQMFVIDQAYAKVLMKKTEVFENDCKIHKQIFLAMVTSNGLKQNVWSKELINNNITISDLF